MLTRLEAIHPRFTTDPFVLDISTFRTDPFRIINIDGLGPVAAEVASDTFASFDGEQVTGSYVGKRNIVLTIGLNPDYSSVDGLDTVSKLRQELYRYFMPKQELTLKFTMSNITNPCVITGIVETVEPNIFAQDPEIAISILCPMPYFVEDNVVTVTDTALTSLSAQTPMHQINYAGTVPTGFSIMLDVTSGTGGTDNVDFEVISRSFDPGYYYALFRANDVTLTSSVNPTMTSKNGEKNLTSNGTSILKAMSSDSKWPNLFPGENYIICRTNLADPTVVTWTLTYSNLYGGL